MWYNETVTVQFPKGVFFLDSMELSRFDRVPVPIILLTPRLELMYCNPIAKRQSPTLTVPGVLQTLFPENLLFSARNTLGQGQVVQLPYRGDSGISLLLEPVFTSGGNLRYVFLFVQSAASEFDSLLSILTDGELLRLLQREVAEPLHSYNQALLRLQEHPAARSNPSFSKKLTALRFKMLQTSLFFEKAKHAYPSGDSVCGFCDANKVLAFCAKQFRIFKYSSVLPAHVPMEEDALILAVCDILSNLYLRQGDKPWVEGELISDSQSTTLIFRSAELVIPLDVPCNGDYDGVDIGMFSVKKRVSYAGGTLSAGRNTRGTLVISVCFPKVRFTPGDVFVQSSEPPFPSFAGQIASRYLSLLSNLDVTDLT